MQAFEAAIDGGADAIYVGGASFNARINAKNFTAEELRDAVRTAHLHGASVYQTVNIMVFDKETDELLRAAYSSAESGVDAFIVSDLGAASILHRWLPEMPLHASTQMSVHSIEGARLLADYGFTRVVPARELSKRDIRSLVENNPLEVEIFIHGAMCVSHSGQCLFSSLVGGRSGNRGLCAQPCRLPYCSPDRRAGDKYPLSLKDMSLSEHVTDIIDSGVASLKIEGRMKSPEYVRGVTAIWRRLLDEGRNASPDELRELSDLFSRGGFTDGYYTERINKRMLGVRSDEDKQASREIEKFTKISRRIPVDMQVSLKEGCPATLSLTCKDKHVTVRGECPQAAISAPMDSDAVSRCITKLGGTCFSANNVTASITGDVMMPVSQLNALRRDAVAALEAEMCSKPPVARGKYEPMHSSRKPMRRNVARFLYPERITKRAREFFDIILTPLDKYANTSSADGFIMPEVIFDSETEGVISSLTDAAKSAKYVLVSNLAHVSIIKKWAPQLTMIADHRFNVGSCESVRFLEDMGCESVVLSTELTLPQIRDVRGAKAVIVYGRLPLMTLEKCVIKELYGDKGCEKCARGLAQMKDRRGFIFPIIRLLPHRNIILNSLPTYMGDRQSVLDGAGISDRHFVFTTESPEEIDSVIQGFLRGSLINEKVRRI